MLNKPDDPGSIQELERRTLECLDNERVRLLYVSAQVCNVDQKIDAAISETMRLYGHSTRTAAVPLQFSGMAGTSTVSFFLCKSILNCFGYDGIDTKMLKITLTDILWASMDSHILQTLSGTLFSASEAALASGVGAGIGLVGIFAAFLGHLAAIPGSARAILMSACDIILVLERAFWFRSEAIGPDEIRAAAEEYKNRSTRVHNEVKSLVPLTGFIKSFRFGAIKVGIGKIVREHRFQRDN